MSRTTLVASSLILLSALAQPHIADAGELVVVWLEDGRMLAGEVDPRTNDDRLWLRSSSRTFVVSTSAGWEQIKAVNAGGVRLPVDEFSKRMDEFLPKGGEPTELPAVASAGIPNVTTPVIRSIPQKNAATRVTSLDVEARVANWDQDAETDGVEIRVFPRNTFGELVPVSGQITATLVGRDQLPTREHSVFPQLGRWSLQADTSDFGSYGGVYRLPFRNRHPDQDRSLVQYGLVEVSLYVAGQGRFTSDATIYLYPFNPVRRDMQQHAHDRNR